MKWLVLVLALGAGCDLYFDGAGGGGPGGGGPGGGTIAIPPDAVPATACADKTCPVGTECVLSPTREAGWNPVCVTPDQAGSCNGPTACDLAVICPTGTTPGVKGVCYTPYCIPLDECPPAT